MTLIPLTTNPSLTVGTIEALNDVNDFVGEFQPDYLGEWAQRVKEELGDGPVYLYSHLGSMATTARWLSATKEHGGTKQVVVAGCDCDDVEEGK